MVNRNFKINDFDLYDPPSDLVENSNYYYSLLRKNNPVHKNPDGSYVITSYNELVEIYRNHNLWSSDKKQEFKPKFGNSSLYEHHTKSVVFIDQPDHTRIRKIFQHAFTPKALAYIENNVENLVKSYINELKDKKIVEFVSDFSFRLPVDVVCDILGVPKEDRALIRDWARLILGALEPTLTEEEFKNGCDAVTNFKNYLKEQVVLRKRKPHLNREGEIISTLISAQSSGIELSEVELLHQCIFMLNAGHETSTNMLSHGINELINNKDEFKLLKNNPNKINSAIEEILRFQPPIQVNNRRNKQETILGDTLIPEGSSVHMIIAAANRDPKQFTNPDNFIVSRQPNRHLSFGLGIHICAGNTLARIEGKVAFSNLINHFKDFNLISKPKIANRIRFREIEELKIELSI
jgi:hypothetical protein